MQRRDRRSGGVVHYTLMLLFPYFPILLLCFSPPLLCSPAPLLPCSPAPSPLLPCSPAPLLLCSHPEHLPRHLQPVDLNQHVVQLPAAGGLEDQLAVANQAQAALGVGQRIAGDDLLDVRRLGGRLFEELEAGRHVGEEVFHRDQRTGRPAARLAADLAALGHADQRAGLLVA